MVYEKNSKVEWEYAENKKYEGEKLLKETLDIDITQPIVNLKLDPQEEIIWHSIDGEKDKEWLIKILMSLFVLTYNIAKDKVENTLNDWENKGLIIKK